jgi:G3E family GTPase
MSRKRDASGPRRTPVTLLSGFLGAGKTTLLKNMLENKEGLRIGVVVNDVASVNIDAKLVKGVGGGSSLPDDTIELQNGCACCSAAEEFMQAIDKLIELAHTRGVPYDHIVVESTGVAEPNEVRAVFQRAKDGGEELLELVELETLVTVVDASTFVDLFDCKGQVMEQPELGEDDGVSNVQRKVVELLVEQVETADVLVLNKADQLKDALQLETLRQMLSAMNPLATLHTTSWGKVELGAILSASKADDGAAARDQEGDLRRAVKRLREDAVKAEAEAHTHVPAAHGHGHAQKEETAHGHGHAHKEETAHGHGHVHKEETAHGHGHAHKEETVHGHGHAHKEETAHGHGHAHKEETVHGHGHAHKEETAHGHGHAHKEETAHGHGHAHKEETAHGHAHAHTEACKEEACTDPSHAHGHAHAHTEACKDEACTDPAHTHGHAHKHKHAARHAERFGITSFVYSRRRPFHPQRLVDNAIQHLPAKQNLALKDQLRGPANAKSPFASLVRSKGFLWLSNNHLEMFYWAHAGNYFEVKKQGYWWAAIERADWPAEDSADIEAEMQPLFGDRRQEIVFIGIGLDEAAIVAELDQCLLTDAEMLTYKTHWATQFPNDAINCT